MWGECPPVDEDYNRRFRDNWELINTTIDGTCSNETITLHCPDATSISQVWYLGVFEAVIDIDKYNTGTGSGYTIYYRTGATSVACLAASWTLYNGTSFTSLGWIQIRITKE